jgi:hypothetical protein
MNELSQLDNIDLDLLQGEESKRVVLVLRVNLGELRGTPGSLASWNSLQALFQTEREGA